MHGATFRSSILFSLLALGTAGCPPGGGGADAGADGGHDAGVDARPPPVTAEILPPPPGDPLYGAFKTSPSGQAQIRTYFEQMKTEAPVVDMNGDGHTLVYRTFVNHRMVRSERKTDGKLEFLNEWQPGHERATDYEGPQLSRIIDTTWDVLNRDVVHVQITRYSGVAGQPDTRETYTIDTSSADQEVVIEVDARHDGSWTESRRYTRPTMMKATRIRDTGRPSDVVIVDPPSAGVPCPSAQDLLAAFDDAAQRGGECLAKADANLAKALRDAVSNVNTEFHLSCADLGPEGCGETTDGLKIVIGTASSSSGCGGLAEVIFHELMHGKGLLGPHQNGDGRSDAADRVYGCALGCFRSPNSVFCAQCRGSKNGDPSCSPDYFKPVICPDQYCGCNGTYYRDGQVCTAACLVTLACFDNICGPVPKGPCGP